MVPSHRSELKVTLMPLSSSKVNKSPCEYVDATEGSAVAIVAQAPMIKDLMNFISSSYIQGQKEVRLCESS